MQSNKGFTLSEILVSLVVISVGLLALSTLALYGFNEFQSTKSRIETENEAVKLQVLLTSFLGQAVNIGTGAPPTNLSRGGILNQNFDRMADPGTDITLMASFLRDTGGRSTTDAVGTVIGEYRPSAIWWHRPTATTAGVLFFYGNPTSGAPTYVAARPSYSHQYVTRLTEIEFASTISADAPSAVRVRAVFRYFKPGMRRSWCPQADIAGGVAGCDVGSGYHLNIEKSFQIILRNNVVRNTSLSGMTMPQRPLGPIYFFNPVIPIQWDF